MTDMIILISAVAIVIIISVWAIIDCRRQTEHTTIYRVVDENGNTLDEFDNVGDAMDCCTEYLDKTDSMPQIIIVKPK